MGWQKQLDRAISSIKTAAESERARTIAARAKVTAVSLASKAKAGALGAADAFLEANRDASALTVRFLNVDLTVLSPSEGISVSRPDAATLVVSDGQAGSTRWPWT